jgi:thiol-disulfide isomerase/thioredoxin
VGWADNSRRKRDESRLPFSKLPIQKHFFKFLLETFVMDKILLRRRQLLIYLGLGATGTGAATALGLHPQETAANLKTQIPDAVAAALPRQMLAEFQGISQWLNSSPLKLADLRGQVVLIQFWTFSCINCQRTLPYIVRWHRQYENKGLKVIGVHTPEFGFERDANNVKQALQKNKITYPVPLDNAYKTWNAYSNQYWPNLYLADRQGVLRYSHSGEGAYDTTEQTIRSLLG